jgi:levanase
MPNNQITRRAALGLLTAAAASRLTACSGGTTTGTTTTPVTPPTPNTRPRFNLTPDTAFINDPQRPLWFNNVWNLWVLWNNTYPTSGGTAWKHYTSADLIMWADRGVSIPKYTTPQGDVWTGSTIIDTNNTAGYGTGAIIALMTQPCDNASGQNQSTCLWYSMDGGTTFIFGSVVMPNYLERIPLCYRA